MVEAYLVVLGHTNRKYTDKNDANIFRKTCLPFNVTVIFSCYASLIVIQLMTFIILLATLA